jgi:hypothetical protein
MCGNRQTANDAILYKRVAPRTVRLIGALPGATPIGTEKLEQTKGFALERFDNSVGFNEGEFL